MNRFFYIGINEDTPKSEIKHILLINGICFIIILILMLSSVIFLFSSLSGVQRFSESSMIIVNNCGVVLFALLLLILNKKQKYFISKNLVILVAISSTYLHSLNYGITESIGLLILINLLMPLMLFVKKWQIILYSLITIASLLFTYVSLYNSEPLILLSEETQNIHNIINIITMIVVIYLISLWFRIQGDARETELSSTLQKLESSNKTLKDFSSYLNHEIRNPLSGIIGISDLLLKKTVVTEQQKKYIQLINENGKVLLDLANEVLTSSKIDAGKVELNACTFDIYDTVENISNTYRAKAIEKNLELETIFMDGIPNKVVADQCKVRQVLINLVCNAIKFTETGKVTIKVSLHPEDNQKLLTEVSDTGVGIEQIHFDKIFLPFVQVNKDFKGFGTGLGLSISKSLAIIMDGDITVESEKEKGSCFNFSFKFDTNPN